MSEMSNNEWEKVQKIKTYRKKALEVLQSGGALQELALITDLGMNLRIACVLDSVVVILHGDKSFEEKAQLIAEKLIEV